MRKFEKRSSFESDNETIAFVLKILNAKETLCDWPFKRFQGIPEAALRKLEDGSLVYLLQDNAELAGKLSSKVLPKRIDTTVSVGDGLTAPVKMSLPPHMVEGEQYPLLVYVYGGPGSQMVDDRCS